MPRPSQDVATNPTIVSPSDAPLAPEDLSADWDYIQRIPDHLVRLLQTGEIAKAIHFAHNDLRSVLRMCREASESLSDALRYSTGPK